MSSEKKDDSASTTPPVEESKPEPDYICFVDKTGKRRPLRVMTTGFGPLTKYPLNSSWEALKVSRDMGIKCRGKDVCFILKQIEVSYEYVIRFTEALWDDNYPDVCIHVGMAPKINVVKLEKYANNLRYYDPDNFFRIPMGSTCWKDAPNDILESSFDLEKIRRKILLKRQDVKIDLSYEAGNYLSDFLYYSSLYLERAPVLLVRIPMLNKPYTKEQLAVTLKHIIEEVTSEMIPLDEPELIDVSKLKTTATNTFSSTDKTDI